jgi:parallel beta-helix repeat protein
MAFCPASTGTIVYKPAIFALLIAFTGAAYVGSATPESEPAGYNVHVATTGSDANPGSQAEPFRTIQRAASMATPGTTVHVAPGIYRENVRTRADGTATARIRYVSVTKWGARIIGSGTEAMWRNDGNYTDVVGFDISGSGRLGILNHGSHTLMARNHVHHLAVSGGCVASGGAGIVNANYRGSDGDVIGNVVHDIGIPGKCNGVQGIYSANLRGRIYNNIVYRASAYGIHLWHAADNVTIANNTVFANGAAGMGGGIIIGAGDSPGGVVLNNTRVINNIVFNNPDSAIREYCYRGEECTGAKNTIANNLVFGNGSGISLRQGAASGTIAADPQFVDFRPDGSGNYRLKSSSPAVNSGLPAYAPATDIDNAPRPRGAAPDIGAYENY